MNGPADGLMTDKEKKTPVLVIHGKTTHCHDNYKCQVTAVKVNGVWESFFLKGSSTHTHYFGGREEFSMQIFRSIPSLGTEGKKSYL